MLHVNRSWLRDPKTKCPLQPSGWFFKCSLSHLNESGREIVWWWFYVPNYTFVSVAKMFIHTAASMQKHARKKEKCLPVHNWNIVNGLYILSLVRKNSNFIIFQSCSPQTWRLAMLCESPKWAKIRFMAAKCAS